MSRRLANTLLLFAGIIWGMGFIAQQTAMEDVGPMLFMTLRFLLATLVVIPFAFWERSKDATSTTPLPPLKASIKQAILVGLLFFSTMALQQVGLLVTTVTSAGFLTGLYVIIVPVMVLIILRQKQHWVIWPGAVTAMIGIYLLGGEGFSGLNQGDILVIIGAFIGAGHIVLMGYSVQKYGRPVQTAVIQFAVAGIVSLIAHLIFANNSFTAAIEPAANFNIILQAAPEILYGGIFAGGLAFTLMAIGQRYTSEANAAILLSSEALFAALFAAILLDERLDTIGYMGCFLIFAAILMVQLLPGRTTNIPAKST